MLLQGVVRSVVVRCDGAWPLRYFLGVFTMFVLYAGSFCEFVNVFWELVEAIW